MAETLQLQHPTAHAGEQDHVVFHLPDDATVNIVKLNSIPTASALVTVDVQPMSVQPSSLQQASAAVQPNAPGQEHILVPLDLNLCLSDLESFEVPLLVCLCSSLLPFLGCVLLWDADFFGCWTSKSEV